MSEIVSVFPKIVLVFCIQGLPTDLITVGG